MNQQSGYIEQLYAWRLKLDKQLDANRKKQEKLANEAQFLVWQLRRIDEERKSIATTPPYVKMDVKHGKLD